MAGAAAGRVRGGGHVTAAQRCRALGPSLPEALTAGGLHPDRILLTGTDTAGQGRDVTALRLGAWARPVCSPYSRDRGRGTIITPVRNEFRCR